MDGDEAVKALVVKVLWFFREYSTSATLRSDAVEELQTGRKENPRSKMRMYSRGLGHGVTSFENLGNPMKRRTAPSSENGRGAKTPWGVDDRG